MNAKHCVRDFARAVATMIAAMAMTAASVDAQSRPSGQSRLSTAVVYETVSFGAEGIAESGVAGADSLRIMTASQLGVPIQFSTIFGSNWSLEVGTSFSSGTRTRRVVGTESADAALSGIGDVRARLSRRFVATGLRLTVGVNVPTGKTKLDAEETAALTVLAAPALMLQQPAVGFGPGASFGLAKSFMGSSRRWAIALAGGVEWRGSYEPLAALVAGAPANAYAPGPIFRVSGGATRLFGAHKGQITASMDIHSSDRIRPISGSGETQMQMGPSVSVDGQWMPALSGFKSAVLYAGIRTRGDFSRDNVVVANSGNSVMEAGLRMSRSLSTRVDWVVDFSARSVGAIEIDNRLATAASTSVAPGIGLVMTGLNWSVSPMVGARFGSIDTGLDDGSFRVITGRLGFERRF